MSEATNPKTSNAVAGRFKPFVIRWLWEETTKQALIGIAGSLYLIFGVLLVTGPMFVIAALADAYSNWFLLLYIPWAITLPLTGKPIAMLFE